MGCVSWVTGQSKGGELGIKENDGGGSVVGKVVKAV